MSDERRPSICVIGDVLADTDVLGHAERLSPEAPVPVVDEDRAVHRAGGAGLAATLAARSGARVSLVTALADDPPAVRLRELLIDEGVALVPLRWNGTTIEKVRIHADGRPLVRIDRGEGTVATPSGDDVARAVARADAVLVADYGKGVASDRAVRDALTDAVRKGTPVVWDPHRRGPSPIPGSTVVCPNEHEVGELVPDVERPSDLATVVARARVLRTQWHVGAVAATRGVDGVVLVLGDGAPLSVPVLDPTDGGDTCGAGDAFAAAAALAMADGAVVSEAIQQALVDASAFVAAGGARSVADAAARAGAAPQRSARTEAPGRMVVATGGCFDLLHPGHIHTLQAARCLGDRLVVLVNDDASVRRLKGPDRPVQPVEDRCAVLRSLACVDEVVVFSEDTPEHALRAVRPDVFVKGGDYTAADIPETHVLAEWGGSVVTVPFLDGRSTTRLVSRVRQQEEEPVDARMG